MIQAKDRAKDVTVALNAISSLPWRTTETHYRAVPAAAQSVG